MADDLIKVVMNDKSASVSPVIGATAATVIKATRGGNKPIRFERKSSKRITDYFGIPDTGSEGVDDVLNYNDSYPIWVAAPSTGGKYGGVLVTKTGTIPFAGGKDAEAINFSLIKNTQVTTVMNGTATQLTATLGDSTHYVNQSLDILVNGVSITVSASNAEPEILTTVPSIGTGTFTRATGVLLFTFTTAPVAGTTTAVTYNVNRSTDAYYALFNTNPQADDLQVQCVKNANNDFVISLYKKSATTSAYNMLAGFPKTGSIVVDKKDGYGQNMYIPALFPDTNDYITGFVNTALPFDTFTDDTAPVSFAGGVRGTTSTAQLTAGWEYFKSPNTYAADIFFDTTADTAIPSIFNTLRNSYQKYSYYIFPTANVAYDAAITAMTGTMPDNKGLACYFGYGKIINQYTGKTIASSLMGRRALRLADMYDCFNGLAPAYFNENGTHGGQLGSGIIEMFYDANDDQQKLLEIARINPTVMHPVFGVTNTRERTTQSLQSDFASIGHTRLVDYLISNIISQALPYQLYKLNDFDHRTRVKSQIEKIISPAASAPYNLLRDYIVKCDEENNNDDVLAREEFVVGVAVKVTPFSKYISLYFTNSSQGADVKQDVI